MMMERFISLPYRTGNWRGHRMLPEIFKLAAFTTALSVSMGLMAWWRKDSPEEDAIIVEAHTLVLDSICNADETRRVEAVTGRNWRDDLTVEDAMRLHEEAELARYGKGRN